MNKKNGDDNGVDLEASEFDTRKTNMWTIKCDEDNNIHTVKLFCDLHEYIQKYDYFKDKGLYISQMNSDTKQGRALILLYGIQTDDKWYITSIKNNDINKLTKENIDKIIDKINVDDGYSVTFQRVQT